MWLESGPGATLIRTLWTGEETTFHGRFFDTRKARLYTRPESHIPLYVSSLSPGSAGFAGTHGDGLLTVGGQPPKVYERMLHDFANGAHQSGKHPAQLSRCWPGPTRLH
jgi:coenzyme F420-dependent glucose-6-phosphate dehydrogenase